MYFPLWRKRNASSWSNHDRKEIYCFNPRDYSSNKFYIIIWS